MERSPEAEPPPAPAPLTALLGPVLSLGVRPQFHPLMCDFLRLQSSALRRRRQREQVERQRRLRQYLRRRRAFLLSSVAAALSLLSGTSRPVWARDRSGGRNLWTAAEDFDDGEFKAQFRVSRATFDHLLELIGRAIKRRKTNYRDPIEPRRRLAITLWWLARSGEYRSIADMFGVGIATVCNIVRQVCATIVELLFRRFVSLLGGPRLDRTLRAFRERCCPQCAGAIGGTHIPIAPPRDNPEHYLNRRGWHSVILQAVVDHNVCFTDVYAGWPGSSSNSTVLSSSDLYLKAQDRPDGYLFPPERSVVSDGVQIPVHLVGDPSFPLKPWLMKPYTKQQQRASPERRRFSSAVASARSVVDTAFARLRGRWRGLLRKSDVDVSAVPRVIAACCILHNVCELRGDAFLPEWTPTERVFREGDGEGPDTDPYCPAEVIRDTLTYNLLTILQY